MAESKEKSKKQIPLRLSAKLYSDIAKWADSEFRSVNGQIEYLLTECVKYRQRKSNKTIENIKHEDEHKDK